MHSHNEIIGMRRGLVPVCSDWRTVTWRYAVGRLCRDASRANSGYHQFCGRVVWRKVSRRRISPSNTHLNVVRATTGNDLALRPGDIYYSLATAGKTLWGVDVTRRIRVPACQMILAVLDHALHADNT
jgi:hypothetical protein